MRPVSTAHFKCFCSIFAVCCTCLRAFTSSFCWLLLLRVPAVLVREGLVSSGSKSIGVFETVVCMGLNVIQIFLFLDLSFWLSVFFSSSIFLFLLVLSELFCELVGFNFSFALRISSLRMLASRGRGRIGKYACANGCIRSWLVLVTAASCQLLCAILGPRLSPNTSYSCW